MYSHGSKISKYSGKKIPFQSCLSSASLAPSHHGESLPFVSWILEKICHLPSNQPHDNYSILHSRYDLLVFTYCIMEISTNEYMMIFNTIFL